VDHHNGDIIDEKRMWANAAPSCTLQLVTLFFSFVILDLAASLDVTGDPFAERMLALACQLPCHA